MPIFAIISRQNPGHGNHLLLSYVRWSAANGALIIYSQQSDIVGKKSTKLAHDQGLKVHKLQTSLHKAAVYTLAI